ncbi:hypothetical protein [Desulfonema magnum]|uniref:Uncharacterized protein n=1 Tax=Desulfonema magnum TaxID=45655 RepID=A0A975BLS0_9BACT|nr:hypothetical protein [Desulfonema magnum]QTA87892.1 Uncharacterized protein dnm_039320 [Desulfonema magnum]
MQEATLSEVTIKVPANVADMITTGEIIILLTDKALSRAEYYRSKCSEMEQRHGIGYTDFKKKVEEAEREVFSDWDDLLVWEGYHLGYKEWMNKYEELRNCTV